MVGLSDPLSRLPLRTVDCRCDASGNPIVAAKRPKYLQRGVELNQSRPIRRSRGDVFLTAANSGASQREALAIEYKGLVKRDAGRSVTRARSFRAQIGCPRRQ